MPVIVFTKNPNVHQRVSKLKSEGKLSWDFLEETLFIDEEAVSKADGSQEIYDSYFDSKFIEGFFDKDTMEWVDNPKFWERAVEIKCREKGLSEDETNETKKQMLNELTQKALERLNQISQEYIASQSKPTDEWWKNSSSENEEPPVYIP